MIKIYDDNRNLLISTNEYSNFSILKEINQPDRFSIDTTEEIGDFIKLEGYIETKEGIFVIKEKSFTSYYRVMGSQDLEDFDDFIEHKRFERSTLKEMIQGLVAPYGWTVVGDSPDKKTIDIDNKAVIDGVFDCINLFKYEIKFDNVNKVINIAKELGDDKGTYFHSDLNLKKTTISSDSYDFATRIIPVGNGGLTIESVNNGKKYLENHKYSNKIKTIYWEDERYHIPENLKATAEEMLENLAKPLSSLDCEIVNLVNNSKYSFLDFDVGDKVVIVDNNLKIKEKHRITSYLKYPNEPHRGVVTFENKPRDVIDRFTDIDYRFDNYDNRFDDYDSKFDDYDFKFDDYDFKFDDYDMKFDDFDMRLDDFNLELDQIRFDMGEFGGGYSDLLDRLSVIEEMLGIGLSCIIIKNEDIHQDSDPPYGNIFFFNCIKYNSNCVIIPNNITQLRIRGGDGHNEYKILKVVGGENITDAYNMFGQFSDRMQVDISELKTTNVTNMGNMFSLYGADNIIGLKELDTSNVINMSGMFSHCKAIDLDLTSFDTSNVINMSRMFDSCHAAILDLSSFNTSNVTDMSGMFADSYATSIDLSSFNMSNVTDMSGMFARSNITNLDLSKHDIPLSDLSELCAGAANLINVKLPKTIGVIDNNNGDSPNMKRMFENCTSLTSIEMPNIVKVGPEARFFLERTFYNTPNLRGAIDLSFIKETDSGYYKPIYLDDTFYNCGAEVIYVSNELSQDTIDYITSNSYGIPVVVK